MATSKWENGNGHRNEMKEKTSRETKAEGCLKMAKAYSDPLLQKSGSRLFRQGWKKWRVRLWTVKLLTQRMDLTPCGYM